MIIFTFKPFIYIKDKKLNRIAARYGTNNEVYLASLIDEDDR